MTYFEALFFWLSIFLYVLSMIFFIITLVFRKEKNFSLSIFSTLLGLVPHSLTILLRWIRVGHGPYINRFEVFLSNVWMIIVIFLLAQILYRQIRVLGAFILAICLLLLGWATMVDRTAVSLPPTFHSYWLIVHITFAKIALGSLLIGAGMAILYLAKKYFGSEPEIIDNLSYRFTVLGFFFLGIMIIAGALWAYKSWGRYWGWDPIETWSLLCWLGYGIYLHLRRTLGWRGKKAAYLLLSLLFFLGVVWFGISYFTKTIHRVYMIK